MSLGDQRQKGFVVTLINCFRCVTLWIVTLLQFADLHVWQLIELSRAYACLPLIAIASKQRRLVACALMTGPTWSTAMPIRLLLAALPRPLLAIRQWKKHLPWLSVTSTQGQTLTVLDQPTERRVPILPLRVFVHHLYPARLIMLLCHHLLPSDYYPHALMSLTV